MGCDIFPESALAHALCVGRGLEIGGSAHNPFGLDVLNVDVTDEFTAFKAAEVELCGTFRPVDVVAPGDLLPFANDSQDFVVSSHVLEHFPDPIAALLEWDRVVRVGGVIFAIVPHMERTFDCYRERTTLAHVIRDWKLGTPEDDDAPHGHYHAWITEDVSEILDWMRVNLGVRWEWLACEDTDDKVGNGFTVAVRKVGERCAHSSRAARATSGPSPASGS